MASYECVNWENAPSKKTPLNANNLNKMDAGIKAINADVTALETKAQKTQSMIAQPFNEYGVYPKDTLIVFNDRLYKAKHDVDYSESESVSEDPDITPTNFDPDDWDEVKVASELTQLGGTSANHDELSILFVGNSLTQDGIAYVPYMLRTFYPEVKFRFYMWCNGGAALAQQYKKFTADTECEAFSVAENEASWTISTAKMSDILSKYRFNIVCMQEYFNKKATYADADLTGWNNCRDYIVSHYGGSNGLEFISLFHSPRSTDEQTVYDLTKTGNALILKKTLSDDMIATGIALHMARSTDLDSLGDQGHLTPDTVQAQEGLPCLLEAYTALLWVFDRLGINKSIYGLPFKMTATIQARINVPGANLGTGVIEGTDAQNILAQEVAIMAYKAGKKFVADNLANN